mgnify:FL=1
MVLGAAFFRRSAVTLAPLLVGKLLCRKTDGKTFCYRITETECYFGEEDTACHAHKGRTPRTDTLYAAGGIAYVYLCYGMHSLLNFVTGEEGHPEAVLIRGVEGISGPGRVTKALDITVAQNRLPLFKKNGLWVADDGAPAPELIATPRIGIDYAEKEDRERLWRYLAK